MNAIFKYPIPVKEKFTIDLPAGARLVRVEDVDGLFYLWAIVNSDPDHPKETRYFENYKTGQPIETPLENLVQVGICKIFVMQELCLYVFENTVSP